MAEKKTFELVLVWRLVVEEIMKMRWDDDQSSSIGVVGQTKSVRDAMIRDITVRAPPALPMIDGDAILVDVYIAQLDVIIGLRAYMAKHGIDPLKKFNEQPSNAPRIYRMTISMYYEAIHKAAVLRVIATQKELAKP